MADQPCSEREGDSEGWEVGQKLGSSSVKVEEPSLILLLAGTLERTSMETYMLLWVECSSSEHCVHKR